MGTTAQHLGRWLFACEHDCKSSSDILAGDAGELLARILQGWSPTKQSVEASLSVVSTCDPGGVQTRQTIFLQHRTSALQHADPIDACVTTVPSGSGRT